MLASCHIPINMMGLLTGRQLIKIGYLEMGRLPWARTYGTAAAHSKHCHTAGLLANVHVLTGPGQ